MCGNINIKLDFENALIKYHFVEFISRRFANVIRGMREK